MLDFFKKSLRNKLLAIFMVIGFMPFLTLLTYTIFLSETKIVNKIVVEQSNRLNVVVKLIDNHINALIREVNFLSSLDLMDDLLAEDIDKRISRLLTQKLNDLGFDATFIALSEDSIILASSDKELLQTKFPMKVKDGVFLNKNQLYIVSSINASFDTKKKLGFLILKYNLQNLDSYLTHQTSTHSYIINPTSDLIIGENLSIKIDFNDLSVNNIINDLHVVVYEKLSSVLSDLHIVYAVDKNVALEFLYDFISFMLYMSAIIFILIIYISFKQSKEIVRPIEQLTRITDSITSTQNYTTQVEVSSSDEIATLTHSFNTMIEATSSALEELEKENKLRLQRFTQLIEVFNIIIQTKTEDECIEVSMQEIRKLTNKNDLSFQKNKSIAQGKQNIDIDVTDFENNKKVYFGSIELDIDELKDMHENNFYNSIASMITLQLDRIRLIQRTMSASNAKSAFISNMSHELRTPLNAIIGFAQFMITYEELNEDQMETVGNIESSAQYLLGMINEILDIAKIEAGKMEAHVQEVDILGSLQNIKNMLEPLASEKNLDFNFNLDNLDNLEFYTDPKMFQQIIINMLSNAIKFTEKGSVSLHLSMKDNIIYIRVKDTGIGLSKESIKGLFNDFTQVENVMQKKHKGTGLGLSLSKKMAQILNGDIYLESEGLGNGTSCIFQIPNENRS